MYLTMVIERKNPGVISVENASDWTSKILVKSLVLEIRVRHELIEMGEGRACAGDEPAEKGDVTVASRLVSPL